MVPDALALSAQAQILGGKFQDAERNVTEGKRLLSMQGRSHSLAGARLTFADGLLLTSQNRFEDSRPHFEAAITQAQKVDGPQSNAATEFSLYFALELIEHDRSEDGRRYGKAAIAALEASGDIGRVRAARAKAALQQRQFSWGTASFSETVAVLDGVSAYLRSRASSIPAEVLAEVDYYRARAYVEWGEYSLARPLLESSAAVLLRSTQSLSWQARLATVRGWCAMHLGEHETADGFLREGLDAETRLGRGNHPITASKWGLIAVNLSMQGRHREAEAVLSKAPVYAELQGDPQSDYARVIPQTLTRVRLDAGDLKGARQSLPTTDPPREDDWEFSSYYQLRGEIGCASGDHHAGLADLTRSLSSQSAVSGPNKPWLARLRAVAGLCALSLGDRKRAEEFANEARRAFDAQPNVSPYFKESLTLLEKQLNPKLT
jgi:tetratricopeptide (TPR) repeat protein